MKPLHILLFAIGIAILIAIPLGQKTTLSMFCVPG